VERGDRLRLGRGPPVAYALERGLCRQQGEHVIQQVIVTLTVLRSSIGVALVDAAVLYIQEVDGKARGL
jgi:hypothetical protein